MLCCSRLADIRSTGIGEDVTWEDFTALVCSRLQLRGLKGLYHASTGAPLRSMAELLDVEDLEAEASLFTVQVLPCISCMRRPGWCKTVPDGT